MIKVKNISKKYSLKDKSVSNNNFIYGVKNISFTMKENKIYSIIGESGSGKSTLARLLTYIEKPTDGEIWINNKEICKLKRKEIRKMRLDVQLVLQNSKGSLDARRTIYESIAEPIRNLTNIGRQQEKEIILNLIQKVQLPMKLLERYPEELSGGQLKRVCIARAMSVSPKFIVFDESISGLDVIVRKKVLDLLLKLQQEYKSTYMFITHDIDAAIYMSRHIIVMRHGEIVEEIPHLKSLNDFQHDYSKSLINAQFPNIPNKNIG